MATLQYVVNAIDGASGTFAKIALSAEDLNKKVDDLAKKRADIPVNVEDKAAQASLKDLDLQLTKLKTKVTDPEISLKGLERVFNGIARADVALDKFGAKHVTATVDVKVNRSGLRGLLSGGALSGLSPDSAGGGGLLSSPLGIGAVAGGGAIAAGLVPSVVGLGIGGLAGAGAIGGGLFGAAEGKKQLNADLASIKVITTKLKTAVGQQKKDLSAALKDANKQYSKDAAFFQPFTTFQASITNLAKTVLAPLRPIMGPLTQLFNQFGKGLTSLGPQFTSLFRASLPFVKQFLGFMLQAGKILLPAFTTALNQMVKSGALKQMTAALVVLTQGLATFIVNLGPGMAASAQIFARLMTFIGRTLGFLGDAFTVIAKVLAFDFPGAAKKGVDAVVASFHAFMHDVAVVFDTVRHFIAASWDATWQASKNAVKTGVAAVVGFFRGLWQDIVSIFNTIRTGVANAWNTIWTNMKNATITEISAVVGFFRALPGKILSALTGLGHSLGSFASAAMNEMWNGFKNVAGSILKWLGGFVSSIINTVKKLLHIGSPSAVFHDIGVNMMLGLERGIKASAHLAANAAKGAAQGAVGAAGGPATGGAAAAQRYARSRLGAYGWGAAQMAPLIALWNQESGWNRLARNASSGAYGIPQALPPGKMGAAANPPTSSMAAQVNWGLSYIKGRYGSPAGAEAHERAFNWYDRGGWLMPGVSMAVNATGSPELVTPNSGPGSMAEVTALLRQLVAVTQAAPSRSAAGFARELNGAATRALR